MPEGVNLPPSFGLRPEGRLAALGFATIFFMSPVLATSLFAQPAATTGTAWHNAVAFMISIAATGRLGH